MSANVLPRVALQDDTCRSQMRARSLAYDARSVADIVLAAGTQHLPIDFAPELRQHRAGIQAWLIQVKEK